MQSRVAQRAYRSRQQAIVDGLKTRISLLETSMEKMSSAMLSFSEKLVQSGVLRGHPALTTNLRDTMKVFLTTASGVVSIDDDEMMVVSVDSEQIIESPPGASQKQQQQRTLKWLPPTLPHRLPEDGTQLPHPTSAILPHAAHSVGIAIIEVSAFIQQLLLVALYQGHLALGDTSIGLGQLQRPFGLLFSMMNRERLKSRSPFSGWGVRGPIMPMGREPVPLSLTTRAGGLWRTPCH
jgi:hypothetical protein